MKRNKIEENFLKIDEKRRVNEFMILRLRNAKEKLKNVKPETVEDITNNEKKIKEIQKKENKQLEIHQKITEEMSILLIEPLEE